MGGLSQPFLQNLGPGKYSWPPSLREGRSLVIEKGVCVEPGFLSPHTRPPCW